MRKLPKEIIYIEDANGVMKPEAEIKRLKIFKQEKRRNLFQLLLRLSAPVLLPLFIIATELVRRYIF